MSEYDVLVPFFIEEDADYFYDYLFDFGEKTAERFRSEFKKKLAQLQQYPFSCPIDTVYPSLTEKQIRKAVIFDGRYLILYMVKDRFVILLMIERAERDYIATFEANLRLFESESGRDG